MSPQIKPRNGHVILQLVRAKDVLVLLPDGATRDDTKVVIVALAPDIPLSPRSNEPQYRVGDAVLGAPGSNIPQLVGTDFGIIHYTAIVAIDER